MFTKPLTRAPWYILIKSFFVAIGLSYLHDLSATFLKRLKLLWGEFHVKSASFSTDNSQTSRFSFCYRISNDKNFIPRYLDNALTDSVLTSQTSRRLLEEKSPGNDFIVRNNAASIIGSGVISLLWQLRCHCNPDRGKFSSLSNTTVVAIFPNVCLWQRIVYAQTWQV